jgi:hypothetical protein
MHRARRRIITLMSHSFIRRLFGCFSDMSILLCATDFTLSIVKIARQEAEQEACFFKMNIEKEVSLHFVTGARTSYL